MKSTIRDHLLNRHASRVPDLNHARCQAIDQGLQAHSPLAPVPPNHRSADDDIQIPLSRRLSNLCLGMWSEVVWIPRFFWGCIGTAWVLIAALDVSSRQPTPSTEALASSPSHTLTALVQEQLRLLREIDLVDWSAPQDSPKPSHSTPPAVVPPPSAAIPNSPRRPSLA